MKLQNLIPQQKKGQVVTNTILGIGALIIGVILTFVIVSTLNTSNLLPPSSSAITTATENESADTSGVTVAWSNETGYALANFNTSVTSINVIAVWADIIGTYGYNLSVPLANVSVNSFGILTNATTDTLTNISITYNVTDKTTEQLGVDRLVGNFTEGIDNVSSKVPTILLIVAVVFLFGALVLLVAQSRRMGIGGGSSL
jgi:hypothetical protein|tara:strand:+ start:111 stop:713 length:603 start_codon:yes stop_codon:yes gene_type:complete